MPQVSMIPEPCRIVDAAPQNGHDVHFVVEAPKQVFAPEPGQFVMVSVPGIGEAPFCVSALPGEGTTEGTFELLIRRKHLLRDLDHEMDVVAVLRGRLHDTAGLGNHGDLRHQGAPPT